MVDIASNMTIISIVFRLRRYLIVILLFVLYSPVMADANPYGSLSVKADTGFLSVGSVPGYSWGLDMSFRMGADVIPELGIYGKAEAGFTIPIISLHRFLEYPSLWEYGLAVGTVYRIGRWSLALEAGVRSYVVSGQQEMMYGGAFIPSFSFLTGDDMDLRYERKTLPIAYGISLPVSVYMSPHGLDLRVGVALTMDVSAWWTEGGR